MTRSEQELRIQLAACYRIFDYLGWTELIYNHITVKLPSEEHHFLINPYGLHYSEIKASNLVKVDIEGNIIDDTPHQVNPAGMLIHSTIHGARPEVGCIAHIHSDAGLTVACQQCGLRADNFYSVLLHGQVAYHDFEGITVAEGEKERLLASAGDKNILILRNHGLLTCGSTIPEAFELMWMLQRSCEIQVAVDSTGKPNTPISQEVVDKSPELLKLQLASNAMGELEFAALTRLIERQDSSYKE